jgi:hypothetical protein
MDRDEHESEERGLPLQFVMDDTSDRRTALVYGGAALTLVAILVIYVIAADDPSGLLVAGLGTVAVVALFAAWWKVRVWAGWGNPQLHLPSSEPLHLGDHVVVRFRRTARGRSGTEGVEVSAVLRVEERAHHQHGSEKRTATEVVLEQRVPVVLNDLVDRTVEADLALDIPLHGAPPTMDLGNNEVHWELVVDMSAPNAPDDVSTFTIDVDPHVANRLQAGGSGR